jgi:hypothetical protein
VKNNGLMVPVVVFTPDLYDGQAAETLEATLFLAAL